MMPGSLCEERVYLDALNFHLNLRVVLLFGCVLHVYHSDPHAVARLLSVCSVNQVHCSLDAYWENEV